MVQDTSYSFTQNKKKYKTLSFICLCCKLSCHVLIYYEESSFIYATFQKKTKKETTNQGMNSFPMRLFHPPCVVDSNQTEPVITSSDGNIWYRHRFHFSSGFESLSALLLPCINASARLQIIQSGTTLIKIDTGFYHLWSEHVTVIPCHPPRQLVHLASYWRSLVHTSLSFLQEVEVCVDVSHPGPVSMSVCLHIANTMDTHPNQIHTLPPPAAAAIRTRTGVIHTNVIFPPTFATLTPPTIQTPVQQTTTPTNQQNQTPPNINNTPNNHVMVKNIVSMSIHTGMGLTTFEQAENIHGLFFDLDYFCPVRIYYRHQEGNIPNTNTNTRDYVDYTSPLHFVATDQATSQRFRAYLPLTNFHDSWSVFTLVHKPMIQLITDSSYPPSYQVSGQIYALSLSTIDPVRGMHTANYDDLMQYHNRSNRPMSLLTSLVQFISRVAESTQATEDTNTNTEQETNLNNLPPSLANRSHAVHRPLPGSSDPTTTSTPPEGADKTCSITLREIDVNQFYTVCPQCTKIFDLDAFLTWWRISPTCPTCRHADSQSWQCYRNSIMHQPPNEREQHNSSPRSSCSSTASGSELGSSTSYISSSSSQNTSELLPPPPPDTTTTAEVVSHAQANQSVTVMNGESMQLPRAHFTAGLVLPVSSSSMSMWGPPFQGQSFFQSHPEFSQGEEEVDFDMFEAETFFFHIPNFTEDDTL